MADEMKNCECGHKRSQHCRGVMGDVLLSDGNFMCGMYECTCRDYRPLANHTTPNDESRETAFNKFIHTYFDKDDNYPVLLRSAFDEGYAAANAGLGILAARPAAEQADAREAVKFAKEIEWGVSKLKEITEWPHLEGNSRIALRTVLAAFDEAQGREKRLRESCRILQEMLDEKNAELESIRTAQQEASL